MGARKVVRSGESLVSSALLSWREATEANEVHAGKEVVGTEVRGESLASPARRAVTEEKVENGDAQAPSGAELLSRTGSEAVVRPDHTSANVQGCWEQVLKADVAAVGRGEEVERDLGSARDDVEVVGVI